MPDTWVFLTSCGSLRGQYYFVWSPTILLIKRYFKSCNIGNWELSLRSCEKCSVSAKNKCEACLGLEEATITFWLILPQPPPKRGIPFLAQIMRRTFIRNAEGCGTGPLGHELHPSVVCRQVCRPNIFLSSLLPYLKALGGKKNMVGSGTGRE